MTDPRTPRRATGRRQRTGRDSDRHVAEVVSKMTDILGPLPQAARIEVLREVALKAKIRLTAAQKKMLGIE